MRWLSKWDPTLNRELELPAQALISREGGVSRGSFNCKLWWVNQSCLWDEASIKSNKRRGFREFPGWEARSPCRFLLPAVSPTLICHFWAMIKVGRNKKNKNRARSEKRNKRGIRKEKGGSTTLEYCAEGGLNNVKATGKFSSTTPFISTCKHLTMTHS